MKNKIFTVLFTLLLTTIVSVGCSKKSTVESETTYRVSILVTDDKENPIPGAEVITNPATTTKITDNDGRAEFTDIPGRSYNVIVNKLGCPEFNQFVNLNGNSEANLHFIIISKLKIFIKDEQNRPIIGATLTTIPETQNVITDNTGTTVLENIPVQPYLFTVTPKDLPPIKRNVVLDESTLEFIDFNITSEPPVIQITEPPDGTVMTPFEIVFEGVGNDNEDGVLPDSTLTWRSNIDGKLGTGGKIIVAELSRGNHIITLEGTDIDNKTGVTQITVITVDYDPNSYFPILENSEWVYRHQTPNFYVISGNVSEYWQIKDMSILIDDENRRISTVYYDISIGVVVKHFKYILVDYFETVDGNLYITKTKEVIREWKDDEESNPYSITDIETTYTPRYLALKNLTDPSSEPHYESTVRAETVWNHKYYNTSSPVFRESINLTTTVDVGDMKYIQTDVGYFNAVKISFSIVGSEKHWWLTRGLGLVQLEYNLSDSEQSAVLAGSDILKFYREPSASKPASTISPGKFNTSPPVVPFTLSRETVEGMMELRNYLKSMLP